MPKVTITIEDLPPGDERGNLLFNVSSVPPLNAGQLAGTEEPTPAQQVGAGLNGIIQRMLAESAAKPDGANIIEVRAGNGGVLEMVEGRESIPATPEEAPQRTT